MKKLICYLGLSVIAVWLPESSWLASPLNDFILVLSVAMVLIVYNRIQSIRAGIKE